MAVLLVLLLSARAETLAPTAHPTLAPVAAVASTEEVGYYGQWDIYGNAYYPKTIGTSGAASRLTTLVYGFENIDPVNLTCFQTIKATSNDESDPNAGDGAGDAWADYQKPFGAAISVNGKADSQSQPLKGNFNQLKELKAKYPKLKILVSIGGWTFSKYFSRAAATRTSRAKLVSSCISMYIKGNLPKGVAGDKTSGGSGVAANIFDGIDIDWEFPGTTGHAGNLYSAADRANYTALLAEFRTQLNAAGVAAKKRYLLTAAVPSVPSDIARLQASGIAKSLDWANVMAYDMHGVWEENGPTNFQAPLHPAASDPAAADHLTVSDGVNTWLKAGMPANKIVLGIPFYWRGWSGVAPGGTHGLYQRATGASPPYPFTRTAGTADYHELLAAGKLKTVFYDAASGDSPWVYDGNTFYTGETPASIRTKTAFIKSSKLRGAMVFSLAADTATGTLLQAVTTGLR